MKSLIAALALILTATACADQTQDTATTTTRSGTTTTLAMITTVAITSTSSTLTPGVQVSHIGPLDILALVPDLPEHRNRIRLTYYEMTRGITSTQPYETGGTPFGDWLSGTRDNVVEGLFEELTAEDDIETFESEFGFWLQDVAWEILAGSSEEAVSVMGVANDQGAIAEAIQGHPIWGPMVTIEQQELVTLYDWGTRNVLAESNSARPLGRAGVLVKIENATVNTASGLTSGPGDLVIRATTREKAQAFIGLLEGEPQTMADIPEFAAMAEVLQEEGASSVFLTAVPIYGSDQGLLGQPGQTQDEALRDFLATNILLAPYSHVGLGRIAETDGWHGLLVLVHRSDSAASSNSLRIRQQVEDGQDVLTRTQLSEILSINRIEQDSNILRIFFESQDDDEPWDRLMRLYETSSTLFQIDDIRQ